MDINEISDLLTRPVIAMTCAPAVHTANAWAERYPEAPYGFSEPELSGSGASITILVPVCPELIHAQTITWADAEVDDYLQIVILFVVEAIGILADRLGKIEPHELRAEAEDRLAASGDNHPFDEYRMRILEAA